MMKKIKKMERGRTFRLISGLAAAYIIIFLLLLISAALTSKGSLPESSMKTVSLIACFLGSLVGTISCVRAYTGRRFLLALGEGGLILLVLILTGFVMSGQEGFGSQFIINAAAVLLGTLIVGLMAKTRRKSFKRR